MYLNGKCYPSQRKNNLPHVIRSRVIFSLPVLTIINPNCTCAKGLAGGCGHIAGVLYQIASYKMLKMIAIPQDAAKTSLPQTWYKPRGEKIAAMETDKIALVGYSSKSGSSDDQSVIKSTLNNPI